MFETLSVHSFHTLSLLARRGAKMKSLRDGFMWLLLSVCFISNISCAQKPEQNPNIPEYYLNIPNKPLTQTEIMRILNEGIGVFNPEFPSLTKNKKNQTQKSLKITKNDVLHVYFMIINNNYKLPNTVMEANRSEARLLFERTCLSQGSLKNTYNKYVENALKQAKKHTPNAYKRIKAAFKDIQNNNDDFKSLVAQAKAQNSENKLDYILQNGWDKFFYKIKCAEVSGCKANCRVHRVSFDELTADLTPLCMLIASKNRIIPVFFQMLRSISANFSKYVEIFNRAFTSSGLTFRTGHEILCEILELGSMINYVLFQSSQNPIIITMEDVKFYMEKYFDKREQENDLFCDVGSWCLWRRIIKTNYLDPKVLAKFVEKANEMMISWQAWEAIAKLVHAFCFHTGLTLSQVFCSPFIVKNFNSSQNIISFMECLLSRLQEHENLTESARRIQQTVEPFAGNFWLKLFEELELASVSDLSQQRTETQPHVDGLAAGSTPHTAVGPLAITEADILKQVQEFTDLLGIKFPIGSLASIYLFFHPASNDQSMPLQCPINQPNTGAIPKAKGVVHPVRSQIVAASDASVQSSAMIRPVKLESCDSQVRNTSEFPECFLQKKTGSDISSTLRNLSFHEKQSSFNMKTLHSELRELSEPSDDEHQRASASNHSIHGSSTIYVSSVVKVIEERTKMTTPPYNSLSSRAIPAAQVDRQFVFNRVRNIQDPASNDKSI